MQVETVAPVLRERLGHEATVGLLAVFETARVEWTADVTTLAVDRFERRLTEETARLRVEIARGHADVRVEIGELRHDMRREIVSCRHDISDLAGTLRSEMGQLRFDLLKWSFGFWVGQLIAISGLVGLLIRLMATG